MAKKIIAEKVCKAFPSPRGTIVAIKDFSLEVEDGEFVCIVGPSGCGKSTFLRILAGLVPVTSGNYTILRSPDSPPGKPLNNVVFQEYAIFPWKTVLDNVAFGLQMRGIDKKERHDIALDWIRRVGLTEFANSYPAELSGGMRQRVSIARAFANDPEVLLMDEPLAALDAQTRAIMQGELLRIWESDQKTVVYITHSIDEAVLLGDKVILMTSRPGVNKACYEVPFARPRDLRLQATAEFAQLSFCIWESLQVEVKKAMEEQMQ